MSDQYETVVSTLKEWGFTNIQTAPVYDIVFGITQEGSVANVTINGATDYARGDIFKKDAEIIVTYHMKAESDPSKSESATSQSQVSSQSEPIIHSVRGPVEGIDLDAINATNSAESDSQFVGKTYRIRGVVGEAASPDDIVTEALIFIHPDVMARGMGNSQDLELNIWMAANMFEAIGGETSPGNEVEITAVLSSISRNATSTDAAIKGYPIQLEMNAIDAALLSEGEAESTTPAESTEKYPSGISSWDGDHTELKRLIRANMNDEGSYKHIETKWIYIADETVQTEINNMFAEIGWSDRISVGDFVIITEFSGKNAFNATVKNTAYGIEYKNGNVKLLGIQ
jgi:hypothetical protein